MLRGQPIAESTDSLSQYHRIGSVRQHESQLFRASIYMHSSGSSMTAALMRFRRHALSRRLRPPCFRNGSRACRGSIAMSRRLHRALRRGQDSQEAERPTVSLSLSLDIMEPTCDVVVVAGLASRKLTPTLNFPPRVCGSFEPASLGRFQ